MWRRNRRTREEELRSCAIVRVFVCESRIERVWGGTAVHTSGVSSLWEGERGRLFYLLFRVLIFLFCSSL